MWHLKPVTAVVKLGVSGKVILYSHCFRVRVIRDHGDLAGGKLGGDRVWVFRLCLKSLLKSWFAGSLLGESRRLAYAASIDPDPRKEIVEIGDYCLDFVLGTAPFSALGTCLMDFSLPVWF